MTEHITCTHTSQPLKWATLLEKVRKKTPKKQRVMFSFTATGALKATESFICEFFQKCFFFFFQIIFGLLSVDMRSWTEHLVQSTSFEMRDLTPGSDYGISIQSVLGTDVSRAVIKELSTRKRHNCTWRKTSSVVVGSYYERYVFHYILGMCCLEPVNELSEIN